MNELFLKIINMSISASWLVLAVLILRFVLKKAPKWVNVLLWGIVAVRLICPFSFESALSLIPSSETIDLLKSGRIDNTLLCELAAHPDFPRLMADLEIYVNGTALKQAQGANAIVDTMSATVIKKHNPGMSDTQLRQLITAHIDEDEFCRYVIQRDINGIALALRETHKDDFFSVPEDNPLKEMLETAGEIVSQDSDTEQAYLAFICKRLKLNFRKLSVEERKWLKKIAEKSDLLKNPKPQRGRR
ncbi:M56 family metallopeptidase [Bariatricus sp. HCP28S3_D3]|uniref:M56 family metallopeptidase n=1 Tax=Bariatricus sp. HCP28S3_D3 TaxID=3438901 RepID=UPI003F8B49B0